MNRPGHFRRPLHARLRPVQFLGLVLGLFLLGGVLIVIDLARGRVSRTEALELTRTLGLTDLALSTEARYLRHPSLADLHSAFQDHPASLDHFPAAAAIGPPGHLRPAPHARLD